MDQRHHRRHPGHGRGRADLLDDRDAGQVRPGRRHRPRPRPAAREGHDPLRDHASRIAGADAHRRPAATRSRRCSAVFAKWDLDAVEIGKVTGDGRLKCRFHGEQSSSTSRSTPSSTSARSTSGRGRPRTRPKRRRRASGDVAGAARISAKVLQRPPRLPDHRQQGWVYRQYDHMVLINTVFLPGADAAVLRIKGSKKALAMTLDGNSLQTPALPADGRRCWPSPKPAATWPASAPGRSA